MRLTFMIISVKIDVQTTSWLNPLVYAEYESAVFTDICVVADVFD